MKNTSNNILVDDHSYHPRRGARSLLFDGELPVESTKSCNEQKNCVFERDKDGYGFKITGNAPVKVQSVRKDSFAWKSGLRENDIILEVNGNSVIDQQHKDVVALIRKSSRVSLLVESDNFHNLSSTASLSPKINRLSKYDLGAIRPNSLPKTTPKVAPPLLPKPKPRGVSQKSNNVTSLERDQNADRSQIQNPNPVSSSKADSTDNTSECSISTSSTESDSPKKVSMKTIPGQRVSPIESQNETPTKSNSYNVPKPNNVSMMKVTHTQKKISPDKLKNKTIPPDGAKSFNPTVSGDDMKAISQCTYGTLPKKKLLGRDFEDVYKDDDGSDSSLSLIEMLSSTKDALSKPGLVAILLNYVKEKFGDMKIMIFYYTCKLFKSLVLHRDFQTDAQRMANEIITTFLHEKSPLYVCVSIDVISETLKTFKDCKIFNTLFDPMLLIVYETLKDIVEDIRGMVKRGIQLSEDVSSFVNSMNTANAMNQDREINLLHKTMCNIINRSQKDSAVDDSMTVAIQVGLATMYQFFHKSNFLPGSSVRARSTDSLTNLANQNKLQTIGDFFKVTPLCAPYHQKQSNKRRKAKSVNGHVLIEAVCKEPEECAICEGLLWGGSPQGVFCTMCTNYYHETCRKKSKTQCSRKLRKSNSQVNNKEDRLAFFGRLSRKSSTNSVRSVTMSVSGDNVNNVGNNLFNNSVLMPNDKSSAVRVEESIEMSKSQSEDHLNRPVTTNSIFERVGSSYDLNKSFVNQSIDNGDQGSVQIQELVQDETNNDPDMKIEESFDAEKEIDSVFPDVELESDKKRLIVLLEFYHKTRYILMNLKRFWYTLVIKWPQSQSLYFKALSLDCIEPFVNLIKSLVVTIEQCIVDKKNFIGLEQAVLDWLSDSDDERLKEWISLSSNLCCTNSLNIIKQMKQTTLRPIPELTNLLKAKFHKLIMIEELTQIRPLLISLPLIVKNIIKCLSKQEPSFSDELSVWKQVSIKMDYLCEYIDRCCIPLVDWVNNGSIMRRSEKFDWPNVDTSLDLKNLCQDFPRTLFHCPIFDFQVAKIIAWSTNIKKNEDQKSTEKVIVQTTYFKKGTEVLLIFYKHFVIVLQKENDHYILKPIRSVKNFTEKHPPVIEIVNGMFVTNGGQEENNFVLNIVSNNKDDALLLRIGFSRLDIVDSWIDFINKKSFNLGRLITLFKSNDLRALPEMSHFERTTSNMSSKSKTSQDSFDPTLIPNINPEVEDKDTEKECDKSVINYLTLSDTLRKASDTISSNTALCSLINIQEEDLPNHIKIIKDKDVISEDELSAVLYTLSQTTIQQTHNLLTKSYSKDLDSSEFDVDKLRQALDDASQVLNRWDKSKNASTKIKPKPEIKMRTMKKNDGEILAELQHRLKPIAALEEHNAPDSLTNEIESIIEEIIANSLERVRNCEQSRESRSYKYVPSLSLTPLVDGYSNHNGAVVTPTFEHLNSPIDDAVTVSRAQIVLRNRQTPAQQH